MYRCEIREDFEIDVCGDMISLTLSDLRLLAEGKSLAWNVEDMYSQVLYLDEDAKETLKKIL